MAPIWRILASTSAVCMALLMAANVPATNGLSVEAG